MADQEDGGKTGYGKPPQRTRFSKGQSGNPNGRPKGAKNLASILQKVGRQLVTVNINGRTVRMTKLEAIVHQLSNRAAGGDLRAIRELLYWSRALQEPVQNSLASSSLDEKDQPVMESILRRLREVGGPEDMTDTAPENPVESEDK